PRPRPARRRPRPPCPGPRPRPTRSTTTMTTTTGMTGTTIGPSATTTPTTMTPIEPPGRRRLRAGFRVRVLGLSTALLVAATLTSILVQRAVLVRQADEDAVDALALQRDELEQLAAGRDPATGEPFGGDVRAILATFMARNVPRD